MKFIKDMLSGPPVWDIKTLKPALPAPTVATVVAEVTKKKTKKK